MLVRPDFPDLQLIRLLPLCTILPPASTSDQCLRYRRKVFNICDMMITQLLLAMLSW
ncbi:uncharacterized protein BT62DRAFT_1081049 [Guyanagaster necrorhizus]|uniref:Uncharacterized protein n=1 Tax=Guyanagaster necrorhizus TaxID=856835 RepID=A0A9P7VGC6_9AGAR|nr:uncharacterized protein BT62DRAFT_1081049 [Guyanagaster necrorhizus MCA 3950]KAG7440199.1 hypothetical protein BT62DRAFT_1081049 [Guyanagaster necrorhizus MCA 3950]